MSRRLKLAEYLRNALSEMRSTPRPDEPSHKARLGLATTYFTYQTSLPPDVAIDDLAAALLKKDIAETATFPALEEVRLADRYRDLHKIRRQALALQAFGDLQGLKNYVAWILRNPRLLTGLIRSLARNFIHRRDGTEGEGEDSESPLDMTETLELIEASIRDRQVFIDAQAAVDRALYDPSYLDELPYVRLELRKAYFSMSAELHGDRAHLQSRYEDEAIVTALLHRSGVALITIAVTHEPNLSVDALLARGVSSAPIYDQFIVSETVLAAAGRVGGFSPEDVPGDWETDEEEATRWRIWKSDDHLAVTDLFLMYQDAIDSCLGRSRTGSAWRCYHTVCIDSLGCCSSKDEWLAAHGPKLVALASRFESPDLLSESAHGELLGRDWSLNTARSTFLNSGNALALEWEFGHDVRRHPVSHFWLTALIDNFLIQYGQLRHITGDLSLQTSGIRSLQMAQGRILLGLSEFQQSRIAFGTARQMIQSLIDELGLEITYQRAMDQLEVLARMVESSKSRAAVQRDTILTGAGTLAAIVFALPAVQQAIGILGTSSRLSSMLHLQAKHDIDRMAILVYVGLLLFVLLSLTYVLAKRVVRKLRPPRFHRRLHKFGIGWARNDPQ